MVVERINIKLKCCIWAADIVNIPYGVPVPEDVVVRASLTARPLRLLYVGRIDHEQKRVLAFPELARELTRRGIEHELVLIGDGPAAKRLDGAIAGLPTVHRLAPVPPATVNRWLDRSDALVLASRYEGLSVSMLEAISVIGSPSPSTRKTPTKLSVRLAN